MPSTANDPQSQKPEAGKREPGVPRPPSREEIKEISKQQELLTDEWTGEGRDKATTPPWRRDAPGGAKD